MNFSISNLIALNVVACAAMASLLSSSSSDDISVVGIYELIEVNGQALPAVVWTSTVSGSTCEYRSSGGAVILTADRRSAAFSLEREICRHSDGSRSSTLHPFYMFTGTYDVSANQILMQDELSGDHAVIDGDRLVLSVVGVLKFEGQTSTFVFRKMRPGVTPSTPVH